jgi:hypothetical protein
LKICRRNGLIRTNDSQRPRAWRRRGPVACESCAVSLSRDQFKHGYHTGCGPSNSVQPHGPGGHVQLGHERLRVRAAG